MENLQKQQIYLIWLVIIFTMDCHTELINCIWSLSKENMIQCIKSANVSIGNEVSGRNDMIMIQSLGQMHSNFVIKFYWLLRGALWKQSNKILYLKNYKIIIFEDTQYRQMIILLFIICHMKISNYDWLWMISWIRRMLTGKNQSDKKHQKFSFHQIQFRIQAYLL